jgi:hypothetical protein
VARSCIPRSCSGTERSTRSRVTRFKAPAVVRVATFGGVDGTVSVEQPGVDEARGDLPGSRPARCVRREQERKSLARVELAVQRRPDAKAERGDGRSRRRFEPSCRRAHATQVRSRHEARPEPPRFRDRNLTIIARLRRDRLGRGAMTVATPVAAAALAGTDRRRLTRFTGIPSEKTLKCRRFARQVN